MISASDLYLTVNNVTLSIFDSITSIEPGAVVSVSTPHHYLPTIANGTLFSVFYDFLCGATILQAGFYPTMSQ